MKIFQLLDLIIKLFRLNKDKKAKVIIFGLLSYHAQVQSQMASAFWLGTTEVIEISCDEYYYSNSLLLHMDGANNSTTFTDNSINNFTVTPFGNAKISTAQSKFGGASAAFDGTGDYLSVPSNSGLKFGTGDFTIEFWARVNSTASLQLFFEPRTAGIQVTPVIYMAVGGGIRFYVSGADRITGTGVTTNQWYHVAVSRSGGQTRMFINGTQAGITYADTNDYISVDTRIGIGWDGFSPLNGYIDDLRITKGVARYTSNFTPPTAPFEDVSCSPIISDNLIAYYDASNPESYPGTGTTWFDLSGNNYDLTLTGPTYLSDNGGVFDFDGVNDYALYNTGDIAQDVYSIQMWMKADNQFASSGTRQTLFYSDPSSGTIYASNLQIGQVYNASSQFTNVALQSGVAAYGNDIRTGAGVANIWYNITVLFDGTTNGFDFYVNGSKISDNVIAQGTGRITKLKNILVGATNTSGLQSLNGKIGEFYIYKRKLTESEILLNYNNTKVRYSSSGPVWDGSQTGILDDYPGAAAAYSVRALNSNYTGPLMTIRRASDNVETDVYALASGDLDEAWINSFCSGTTCYVRTWYDQSGNGYNLAASGNPIYIYTANQIVKSGNNSALQFATTNTNQNINLINTSLTLTQPYTIFGIAERTSNSDRQVLLTSYNYSGTNASNFGTTLTDISNIDIYSGTFLTATNMVTTQRFALAGLYNGVNSSTKFNNNVVNIGNAGTNNFIGVNIGGLPQVVNNEYAFIGKISEVIIYNTDFSSNYNGLFSNFNTYYSIY